MSLLYKQKPMAFLNNSIEESLKSHFYSNPEISELMDGYQKKILNDEVNPYEAAQQLLDKYFSLDQRE